MKALKQILKIFFAIIFSILLTSIVTFFYNYTGCHITNENKTTDYIWEPNQIMTTMNEGFSWIKFDKYGFNNYNKDENFYRNIDILLMGSSHMEASQIPKDKNVGYITKNII